RQRPATEQAVQGKRSTPADRPADARRRQPPWWRSDPGSRHDRSQRPLPRLSHEIVPEAVVTFLAHQVKARLLVDVPGRVEHVVRPEHDLAIAYLPGEADAFADQARPDPETTRVRLDQRSEERRVGKEGRSRWATGDGEKKVK